LEEPEYDEENEYIIINRILERAAAAAAESNPDSDQKSRIYVQTYHKRVLVVQNTGNLPLNVELISLEDRGC
jgi:rRNA pseudouridine-1189 N-methylase Emg1 (Nep1/Mra1 family)